ncbi:MAG TPA: HAMP domain-containing sensor histidine kinase [Acidimicrobiales bacterium]|jgi:two-component system OmpR family sensor kinase|nr:HAMP domain-containing sensor histidine kinase [Acidimicrobiales bacterium]
MIRRRLVAVILAVVAAVTGGAGVLIVVTLERRLVADVDQELLTQATAVAPRGGDGQGRPPGGRPAQQFQPPQETQGSPFDVKRYAFISFDASGNVTSTVASGRADAPDPLPDVAGIKAPAGPLTVGSVNGGALHYRVVVRQMSDGGTLAAAISLRDVDSTVRTATGTVLAACALAVVLAGGIVWLTVRRGLRPIDEMIVTAERIAEGELSERAPVPKRASEVGDLGNALNLMLDRIEGAVAAKTASEARTRRFAADASHELRTPLTSIRGYAELYRQGARSSSDVDRAMTRIEREAMRMGDLVEDLLLLARLDQGRPLEAAPVDLTALVLDAVTAARAVEPDRALRVDVGETPAVVTGDGNRLRQVADNLLANVREHTTPTTSVSVTLSTGAEVVTLVVADDGPGMTAEEADRVFDRFWQGEATPEHARRGTGLGLSIVSEIVAAHRGEIRLDTAPGEGARFTVSLPVGGDAAAGRQAAVPERTLG